VSEHTKMRVDTIIPATFVLNEHIQIKEN